MSEMLIRTVKLVISELSAMKSVMHHNCENMLNIISTFGHLMDLLVLHDCLSKAVWRTYKRMHMNLK